MVVPISTEGHVVRQYRHNLKADTLELPAGVSSPGETMQEAALRELIEETGHAVKDRSSLMSIGRFYALPSETNKYVNFFLARSTRSVGAAQGDTEIEKYFDMGTVEIPFEDALTEIVAPSTASKPPARSCSRANTFSEAVTPGAGSVARCA